MAKVTVQRYNLDIKKLKERMNDKQTMCLYTVFNPEGYTGRGLLGLSPPKSTKSMVSIGFSGTSRCLATSPWTNIPLHAPDTI